MIASRPFGTNLVLETYIPKVDRDNVLNCSIILSEPLLATRTREWFPALLLGIFFYSTELEMANGIENGGEVPTLLTTTGKISFTKEEVS